VFNVGSQELLIVLVLVFLLFGPRHIPEVARTLGKGLGELKRTLHGVEESVRRTTTELPGLGDLDDRNRQRTPQKTGKVQYHEGTDDASATKPKKSTPDPFYTSQEGSTAGDSETTSSGQSKDS